MAQGTRVGGSGVFDRQRVAETVRGTVPAVFELEAVDDLSRGVLQLDVLAGVVEAPGVGAGDRQARSVFRLKGGAILDDEDILGRRQLDAREGELHAVGELDEMEVEGRSPGVGQLDELGVRIERVIHDLADPQALGHRPDGKDRFRQPAPRAVRIGGHEHAGLDLGGRGDRDRSGILVNHSGSACINGGGGTAGDQLDTKEQIGAAGGGVHALNGQDVLAFPEERQNRRDIEVLERRWPPNRRDWRWRRSSRSAGR